jgi:glycosyltransferase involved in cell wall biosynthesis
LHLNKYFGYDVVQIINTDIFGFKKYGYNQFLISKIKNNNKKLFLTACGTDSFVYNSRDKLKYNPYDSTILIDLYNKNPYIKKDYINNDNFILGLVDRIIPNMFSYSFAYDSFNKLSTFVPLPLDLDSVIFLPQQFRDNKITIFHGLNRPGFKGTNFIETAMKRIKLKYPDKVEVILEGNLPLKDYLNILNKSNIVIDQCLSYDYGMNALYAMAKGKVVLSGNELESRKYFKRFDIPVINILPSVDDIFLKLEELVLNPSFIIELGLKSRLFVEDFHDSVKIAKQYINIWTSL